MAFRLYATRLALAILTYSSWASFARADPIIYTEQAVASGSLGGLDFTQALVTINLTADSNTVIGMPAGLSTNTGLATVLVGGLTKASFSNPLEVFAFIAPDRTSLGISAPGFGDVLDTGLAPGFFYGLNTSLAPVTGASLVDPYSAFFTDMGELYLTDAGDSTFSAELQDVPEPASVWVLTAAAAMLIWLSYGRTKPSNACLLTFALFPRRPALSVLQHVLNRSAER